MAAQLNQPPQNYTHQDWTQSNKTKYAKADAERHAADRLIDESKRFADETDKRTQKSQKEVNKKFQQRLDDIKYWKKELDDKLQGIVTEIDNLVAFQNRVQKALEATAEPLHIAERCLSNRQQRLSIDLVHDDVQKELMKEVETIQGVQALLQRTLAEAVEQIRLNRKAKYQLEKDLKGKFQAESIDEYLENLKNNMDGISLKNGPAKIEAHSVTPDEWQDFSNANIEGAERERQSSVELRSLVDGVLQSTANDMTKQCDAVNLSFSKRIAETKDTKNKLEDHLNKIIGQIKEMQENISQLQKAVADKEAPLKVAHTRLDTRTQRPNVELCRDAVQYRLIEEVGEIESSIAGLQDRLAQSKSSLKGLVRNQLALEEDIEIKSNTIFVDEVECVGMRKSISISKF